MKQLIWYFFSFLLTFLFQTMRTTWVTRDTFFSQKPLCTLPCWCVAHIYPIIKKIILNIQINRIFFFLSFYRLSFYKWSEHVHWKYCISYLLFIYSLDFLFILQLLTKIDSIMGNEPSKKRFSRMHDCHPRKKQRFSNSISLYG
jgi:hypothetical protein